MNSEAEYRLRVTMPLIILGCVAAAGMMVGSWAPFHFHASSIEHAWDAFWRLPDARFSRSDVVANVLLGMPLPFLLMAATERSRKTFFRRFIRTVFAFLVTVSVGLVCEMGQAWFGDRVPSYRDWAAQACGAIVAISTWAIVGNWFSETVSRLLTAVKIQTRLEAMLSLIVAGVLVWTILPFDFVTSPVEIARKWLDQRIRLIPFAGAQEPWAELAYQGLISVVLGIPVGLWVAILLRDRFSIQLGITRVCLFAITIGVLLEFLQVFVHSRIASTLDAVFTALGAWGGMQSLVWFGGIGSRDGIGSRKRREVIRLMDDPAVWWLGAGVYGMFLCLTAWYPFEFVHEKDQLRDAMQQLVASPFGDYRGSNLTVVFRLIRTMGMSMVLGLLVSVGAALPRSHAVRVIAMMIALGSVLFASLLIEMGQVIEINHVGAGIGFSARFAGGIIGLYLGVQFVAAYRVRHRTTGPRTTEPHQE